MNYLDKLRKELTDIESLFYELLDTVKIEYCDPNDDPHSGVVIITLTCYFWRDGENPIDTRAKQRLVKDRFSDLKRNILFLCDNDTENIQKELQDVFKRLESYIEQKSNPMTPQNIDEAKKNVRKWLLEVHNALNHIQKATNDNTAILIPDTNALVISPDPASYKELLNTPSFIFVITTPVLRELDNQKDDGRKVETYRAKVRKAIKRIKGFRNQGDITTGIIVDRTITVKMDYKEPAMTKAIDWLDPSNVDDQIIIRALELQKQNPCSSVTVVTSDINLQNKALGAKLNFLEPPGQD
ncbi:MAG: PIN domain-containing protein [Bdellovibrionales bacterium]|nr:PIN domain-containing protein [Bdellovibrionales bacterium]